MWWFVRLRQRGHRMCSEVNFCRWIVKCLVYTSYFQAVLCCVASKSLGFKEKTPFWVWISSFDPYRQSLNNYFLDLQILDLAVNKVEIAASVHSVIDKFAERGLRSLAVARQASALDDLWCSQPNDFHDKVCGFLLHSIQLSGAAQGALLMF